MNQEVDYDRVLEYVRKFWASNFRSPSIREVMGGCELSSTSVTNYVLNALAKDGKIIYGHDTTARQIMPIEVYDVLSSHFGGI